MTKVKVIRKANRKHLLLRWTDADGNLREKSSGVPVGVGAREQKANRRLAENVAADWQAKLFGGESDTVSALLESWRSVMESAGSSERYIDESIAMARRACTECKFHEPADINGRALAEWLNKLKAERATKDDPKKERRISHRTHNAYLEACKRFCTWLVNDRQLPSNPLAYLDRKNEDTDRRRVRRAFSDAEMVALVTAAFDGPDIESVDGPTRAIIYTLASWTGLRASELGSLTLRSFNLTANPPTVTVKAIRSKRRTLDTLPLHGVLVQRFRDWLATQPLSIGRPILSMTTKSGALRRTSKMIADDMARAEIAAVNADGEVADFHSLRHTFVTNLARAGVPLAQAQKLARHSDPKLTAAVYTHLAIEDQSKAVNSLPSPPKQKGAS